MKIFFAALLMLVGVRTYSFSQTCLDSLVFLSLENHYREYEHHLKYFSNGKMFFTYNSNLSFCSKSLSVKGMNVVFCPTAEFAQWRRRKNERSIIVQIDKISFLPDRVEFEIIGGTLYYERGVKTLSVFSTNKLCYWLNSGKYGVIENCE
jgi:hypothetical protein